MTVSANCHIQYAACLLLGVPLNESCAIVTAVPSVAIAGIVEVTSTTNKATGVDYSATNFGGAQCGAQIIGPDLVKWTDMTGTMCLIDWGFMAACSGNPIVLDADGNTVGYQELITINNTVCSVTAIPKIAMAIVRKAATGSGGCVAESGGALPFVLHEFPLTTNWQFEDSGFKDERNTRTWVAKGYQNPNIVAGPWNLWPATNVPDQIDPDAFHSEVMIDGTGLPAVTCGTIAHPTVATRT